MLTVCLRFFDGGSRSRGRLLLSRCNLCTGGVRVFALYCVVFTLYGVCCYVVAWGSCFYEGVSLVVRGLLGRVAQACGKCRMSAALRLPQSRGPRPILVQARSTLEVVESTKGDLSEPALLGCKGRKELHERRLDAESAISCA